MGVTFDRQSAGRISRAVRRIEGMPLYRGGKAPLARPTGHLSFWAEITDEPSTGVYDWKLLVPDDTGALVDASPAVTGANAYEINGAEGIAAGTRVRLRLVNHDGSGNGIYLFAHTSASSASGGGGRSVALVSVEVPASTAVDETLVLDAGDWRDRMYLEGRAIWEIESGFALWSESAHVERPFGQTDYGPFWIAKDHTDDAVLFDIAIDGSYDILVDASNGNLVMKVTASNSSYEAFVIAAEFTTHKSAFDKSF